MKKLLLFFAVLVTVFVPFVPKTQAQTGGTIVTLENPVNIWTGINVYSPGNLQLTSPIAPCPGGQFAVGLDATFTPICNIPPSGTTIYPAMCQHAGAPSWCGGSGLTADAYY